MPLKVTAAEARRYAGKSYKPKRRQKAQMDPELLFEAAYKFRQETRCWQEIKRCPRTGQFYDCSSERTEGLWYGKEP